jgi:acetolactate synthase-1/2/3 large subunit
VIAGADEALRAFGEKIQAPITTTLDAKSTMIESDPLFRGMAGLYGRSCTNRIIDQADLVIYVGSNTSDHTTGGWKLPKSGTPIIQIDIDPVEIGRNYPNTIGILSDVRKGLEALTMSASKVQRHEWLASTQALVDAWWQEQTPELLRNDLPMRPQRLCRLLTEVLPEDAILVADTGYSALWSGNFGGIKASWTNLYESCWLLGLVFPCGNWC